MPSGSKKRKSAKKPKPQGPPLDVGSDEAKVSTGEEVRELFPATVGIEGDPEAMAESGLDSNEVIGNSSLEVAREDLELDEAERGGDGLGDSPPLAEPEILAAIESEPSAVREPDRDAASQHRIPLPSDIPDVEPDANNDASAEVIKAEKEPDAGPVDPEPAVYATREAPLDEVKPEADIGLNEIESSKESSMFEREIDPDSDALRSRSGNDETLVDVEAKTDISSTDFDPESGKAADKLSVAAAPEHESETGEPLVEVEDGSANIEQEADKTPNEGLVGIEPEAQIKLEAEVEESETGGVPGEGKLATVAIPADLDIEEGEKQVEEAETAASTSVEPETEEAPIERELGTDTVPVAEVEEAPAVRDVATDVAIADVEPETEAAPSDIDIDSYAQLKADAFQDEVPQDNDAILPVKTNGAVRESEPEADTVVAERGFPTEDSPNVEPEVNTKAVFNEAAPEREPQELEVNAADVVAQDPNPEGEFLINEETEVSVDDVENPPEIESRTELSEETESGSKPLSVAEDTSFEPAQVSEPQSEAEGVDKVKLENEASFETQVEGTGSVETEACQQDSAEGDGKVSLEPNPEAEAEIARGIELEGEAKVSPEVEPESVVEALAETELGEGLIPAEADLQGLVEIKPDQSAVEDQDEQLQNQDGERDIGALESSVFESNQNLESHTQDAEAMEVLVEDGPPAVPAFDAERKDGDGISPLATGLEGEGEGESTMEVFSEERDCRGGIEVPYADVVNTEDLATENGENEERAIDSGLGEDEAFLATAGNGGEVEVSIEQELGSEQPLPANTVDVEECLQEETHFTDQELVSQQAQLLNSLECGPGEPDKDVGDEEAVSSTKAEAGSVLNDSEERAFYEQDLPTNFPSSEQDADVSESKEFPDTGSIPEFVETESREGLDREAFPAETVDVNTPCEEEAIFEQPEVLLESVDAEKPAKDMVFPENAEAEVEPANYLHSAPAEGIPSDEHVPSSPQPVSQESGKDEVYISREVELANEEPKADEEEGASCVAGDELISKTSVSLENGQQGLASVEAPSIGVVENGAKLGVHQGERNIPDKTEILAVHSKESKGAEVKPVGADDISVESDPPISKGRDIKDFEASGQESSQEASLPVVISSQHRDVKGANLKTAERPSEGGALNRRSKFLDCCGMFDLLLKKT